MRTSAPAFQYWTSPYKRFESLRRDVQNPDFTRKCPHATSQDHQPSTPPVVFRRTMLQQFLITSALTLRADDPAIASSSYYDKYDEYASTYENLDGTTFLANILGFNALRRKLLSQATGDVLELGIGTGVNLPLYNYTQVSSVTGLDFSAEMLALAKKSAAEIDHDKVEIRFLEGRAEDVRLHDNTFDTIVDTFSLCVFPEPVKALQEMKRLLKDSANARVLLLEHSLSVNPVLAAYQNMTAEPTAAMSKGCYPNQDVVAMVRQVGFQVLRRESHLAGTVVYLELGA